MIHALQADISSYEMEDGQNISEGWAQYDIPANDFVIPDSEMRRSWYFPEKPEGADGVVLEMSSVTYQMYGVSFYFQYF